ncbi:thioredoxin domain-containing protein [Arthrobacter sp. HLT1-20]
MNRLAGEPSAYLRQHAQNPVHWQPFDPAAFAEAVARDVPIFLSVGYAACHWCHVMAGESFEDPAIGDYLNRHFVSIKVDREERPDVDDAYMAATQALSGQGGWPMSVFLTPDGRAFYAGTYFPPQPGSGRPSFSQLLTAVHEAWNERRTEVERTANELAEALSAPLWQIRAGAAGAPGAAGAAGDPGAVGGQTAGGPAGVELSAPPTAQWAAVAQAAVTALARAEDPEHGGLGTSPKFPPTPALEFLMRQAAGDSGASSRTAAGLAGRALGAMVNSALFDQLAGGFARYSVTADWSEPHYEKMLYDNAGLLQELVHWIRLALVRPVAQAQPEVEQPERLLQPLSVADARRAAEATISWLMAELRLPGGAFASSLDADTVIDGVHHEGASYQWSVAELEAAVAESVGQAGGPDGAGNLARLVAGFMNIPDAGTAPFHPGRRLESHERADWERIRPALLRRRAQRTMPARDDKVVAAWNGQLLSALAEAAMVLDRPDCLVAAVELGEYLQTVHWDGQLFRVSHDGRARGIKGLLDDHAACANGFLALYAATGEQRWCEFAGTLIAALEAEFIVDGVVLNNAADNALPGSKFADPFDNATASGVAQLVQAFTSWAAYTGSAHHRGVAEALLGSLPELARQAPRAAGGLLAAALALTAGPLEVAIVGPAGPDRDALVRQAWLANSPGVALAVWDGIGPAPVPLLEGRGLPAVPEPGRRPLAYVCRNMVCARPVATPLELSGLLGL